VTTSNCKNYNAMKLVISTIRSNYKYHKLTWSGKAPLLEKMKATKSVFVHIPKTGGKSILNALYGVEAHNAAGHATAQFYLSVFGCKKFDDFYKFAFIRNPWDRLYSGYNFAQLGGFGFEQDMALKKELHELSFEQFVKNWLTPQEIDNWTIFRPQSEYILNESGDLMIDKIYYFENIVNAFEELSERFQCDIRLPHINKSKSVKYYKDVYDSEMIEIIARLYAVDLKFFNYDFEGIRRD